MKAPDRPKLNVDDLLRRVRDELAHRRGQAGAPSAAVTAFASSRDSGGDDAYSLLPDLELEPRFETNSNGYAIEDFTRLQHAAFIRAAYRGLLRREADPPGLHHFLQKLEYGDSKRLILGLIRYSPEGRRHAIPVRGLRWRFVLERGCEVPIAGRFVRFLVDLARFPALMREARQNESRVAGQLAAVNEHAAAANRQTYGMAAAAKQALNRMQDQADDQKRASEAFAQALKRMEGQTVDQKRASEAFAQALKRMEGQADDQKRASEAFARALKHMEDQKDDQKRASEAFAHEFGEFYAAFEDKFRGERDDVKGRLAVYVPRLVDAELGASGAPVLDLGCGRGEWLELLRDRGLQARGVDTNRAMLARCRARSLDVTEADALASLSETPAASLGVVTGFHIVEHLPLPYLVSLLKETARTLRSGGIAIFETPNPENVLVGSHTFYLDPTHLNPIPPATLKFFIEAAGLRDVEVMFLHPAPAHEWLATGEPAVDAFVNSRFFGPQDYAVIAHKA